MEKTGLGGRAIGMALAIAFLTGCSETKTVGDTGTLLMVGATAGQAKSDGRSWMLRGASSGELIYATGGCGGTCVLSYADGSIVGGLTAGGGEGPSGNCSDASGNVFIAQGSSVTEYDHGGTSPIAVLSLPGNSAIGCSVDTTSGNLAVIFSGSAGDVALFIDAQGTPTVYNSHINSRYCGYDDNGNLFVSGLDGADSGLSELPIGSGAFKKLKPNNKLGSPGQVQWDGSHLTYESVRKSEVKISRLQITGSTVKIVGTTRFKRLTGNANQSWIYGSVIIIPYGTSGQGSKTPKIGIWKYPGGGKPQKKYTQFGGPTNFQAVTLSV